MLLSRRARLPFSWTPERPGRGRTPRAQALRGAARKEPWRTPANDHRRRCLGAATTQTRPPLAQTSPGTSTGWSSSRARRAWRARRREAEDRRRTESKPSRTCCPSSLSSKCIWPRHRIIVWSVTTRLLQQKVRSLLVSAAC